MLKKLFPFPGIIHNWGTTNAVSKELGVDDVIADAKPDNKAENYKILSDTNIDIYSNNVTKFHGPEGDVISAEEIDARLIKQNNVIKILPGKKVAAHGIVVWGQSLVNENMIRGSLGLLGRLRMMLW
ncbi:hypothetical protein EJ110_NYTH12038 [Nymphaea thermarum]|nr:hypothetical protein EJ110_NYTH12038 [Nymphaea thermarum]